MGTPIISVDDVVVGEQDGYAEFVVRLSAPSDGAVSVRYSTAPGTASGNNADFGNLSGTLSFAPGQMIQTVRVPIIDDTAVEKTEVFYLSLVGATAATIGKDTATATIIDNDAPVGTPIVAISDPVVDEKAGEARFTITLDRPSTGTVSINYETQPGTAGASDFTATSGVLSFAPGETSHTVAVSIADDDVAEANEKFTLDLTLTAGSAAAVLPNATGTTTIWASDQTPVTTPIISVDDVVVGEQDGYAEFVVRLSAPSDGAVSVRYSTAPGTASGNNADFGNLSGTLSFAPGQMIQTVRVPIIDDTAVEKTEVFYLSLVGATAATIGKDTATATIIDNDAPVGTPIVAISDPVVDEKAGEARFTITLDRPSTGTVSINYETQPGTAGASDFTATSGVLSFAPGETSHTVAVSIADDDVAEANEKFTLDLTLTAGSAAAVLPNATGTATIWASDQTPVTTPIISVDDVVVGEQDGYAEFVVRLSAPSDGAVSVRYSTAPGTASGNNADFGNLSGTLSFAPGQMIQTVRVPIIDDTAVEKTEVFYLSLVGATAATIGKDTATATIIDNDAPVGTPIVAISDPVVDEKAGEARFTITLDRPSTGTVSINYETQPGTAGASDFTATSGVLSFAPGETSHTVAVSIADDDVAEANEKFTLDLTLTAGSAAAVLPNATGTATIWASDQTPVTTPIISVDDVVVGEQDGYAEFVVRLSAPSDGAVSVRYSTAPGTASGNNADFGNLSGTLSFAPGQMIQTVRVPIIDDTAVEKTEVFYLSLVGATAATIGKDTATATIIDNDAPVGTPIVAISDPVVDEKAGEARFTITLDRPSTGTVSINYETQPGTAGASDFTATSGVLSFAPGETSHTVAVSIADDDVAEANEKFTLDLTLTAGSAAAVLPNATGTATIWASDQTPVTTPIISVDDVVVGEQDGYAEFVVRLSAPSDGAVSVRYSTAPGTASGNNADFGNLSGTLSFAPGQMIQTVRVPIIDDTAVEKTEVFYLSLVGATAATIGKDTATATIIDNDAPVGTPIVAISDPVVDEKAGEARFTITLDRPSTGTVSINYETQPGTAGASDFTATSGVLSFAPGETSHTVAVSIADDDVAEANEKFTLDLTLTAGSAAAVLPNATGTATIWASDQTPVTTPIISVDDVVVGEQDGYAEFVVRLSAPSDGAVSVRYSTAPGTASGNNADFGNLSGTLSFAPGQMIQTVRVPIIDDTAVEKTEVFYLSLVGATAATIGKDTATATIIDNDAPRDAIWTFDEATGSSFVDAVGGHDGTIAGTTLRSPGVLGNALVLDGATDFGVVPDSNDWNFASGDFTIDFWVNFNKAPGGGAGNPEAVFVSHDEGSGSQNKWFVAAFSGNLEFHVNSPTLGPQFFATTTFDPTPGQWYNIALTKSSFEYEFYVNGRPGGSQTESFDIPDAKAPLTIGTSNEGLGFVNGKLDEVAILHHALATSEIQQVYDDGLSGAGNPLIANIVAAPVDLTLSPASDSGTVGDNITNVATPVITGQGEAGATVTLFDGTTAVGRGTVADDGSWAVQTSALADGSHSLTASEADAAGNISPASAALTLLIDLNTPSPSGLVLAPASDSGTVGDNITNVATPVITGQGEAGATVTVFDGTTAVGGGTVADDGSWAVQTSALAGGTHSLTASEADAAGNISPASAALTLLIDLNTPSPSGLVLAPASDSGTVGDNITNVATPVITGQGEAGATVTLFDGTTADGGGTVADDGSWAVQTSALAGGSHSLTASEADAAGNISPASAALTLLIDLNTPAPSGLALSPASDSGTAGDNITNVAIPVITGQGETGATVTVFDGTTAVGGGAVADDGSWAVQASALAGGSHSLTASEADAAGNISPASAALTLLIDLNTPSPSGLVLAPASDSGTVGDNITNVAIPVITGQGEAGATVTVFDGTTAVGGGTVADDGSWAVQTSALAGGTHSLTASEADAAGNISPASAALTLLIDLNTPSPSGLVLAPASDSGTVGDNITNVATPVITGQGEAGATVTLFDGTTADGGGTVADDGSWAVQTSALAGGSHSLTASEADAAGNISPASAALTLLIDLNTPSPSGLVLVPASDSGTVGDNITNVATPVITGQGEAGATVTVFDGTTAVGRGTVADDGSWAVQTSALADGSHSLTASEADAAGNISPASAALTLLIDLNTPAPSGLALSPASDSGTAGDNITNVAIPVITGQGETGATVTVFDGTTAVGGGAVADDGSWAVQASALAGGSHSLTASEADAAGNISPASAALTLLIDLNTPSPSGLVLAPASDSGTVGDNITNVAIPVITGQGEAGATVTLFDGTTAVGRGTVADDGSWAVQTSALAGGTHSLTASEADAAGNISPASAALTLLIDLNTPSPSGLVLAPASDSGTVGDNITNVATPVITGQGEAGATVTVFDGTTAVGGGTVADDGSWAVQTSALAGGTHSLTASEADAAGNISPASAALTLLIDLNTPSPSGLVLAPASDSGTVGDNITNVATPVITGQGEAGATVTLFDGTTADGGGTVADDGSWAVQTSALAGGSHSLTASEADAAGNISPASAALTLLIDLNTPSPSGLVLVPASDSGTVGDNITNVATPVITGQGEAGATVTVFDGTTAVGLGTVADDGSWSVQASALADGTHSLTASEADAAGNLSGLSSALTISIDTTAPVTSPDVLSVLANAAATPLGIPAPSDSGNLANSLSVVVTALPGDGAVTLDGTKAVSLNQVLSVAQLTGLQFTPNLGSAGTNGDFGYTVSDPAGNSAAGQATISVAASTAASLYDFVFTYDDGKDYYTGVVADDGTHVQVGQTITSGLGQYTVFNNEGATPLPGGTVSVQTYSHNGIGVASPTPVKTAQGQMDGSAGLGSEVDAVLGTDGLAHAFSSTQEASFTTTALFGFIFTYADNKAFYTGTVADDGSFGTTVGTRNVTNSTNQLVGSYTVFANGVTSREAGSVAIDRFSIGDASIIPNSASGGSGLGSESGTLTINGTSTGFGPSQEPSLTIDFQSAMPITPPSAGTVIANQVTELYREILGRDPDMGGLQTYSAALAGGTALATIRQIMATSPEAQNDLNQLYHQIFDRDADTGGLATYTELLQNGETLAAVQAILGTSQEAQDNINQLYLSVLARGADPGGMVTYTGALATGFTDLDGVRGILAHSPEAITDLTTLFQTDLVRPPSAAELVGMEDQLGTATGNGASQTTIDAALKGTSASAGGFIIVTPPTGNANLTAAPGSPTLFAFDNIAFGQDTIDGFDPTRDTVRISSVLAANLDALRADTSSTAAGTLITLSSSQSITLNGISPISLSGANFVLK